MGFSLKLYEVYAARGDARPIILTQWYLGIVQTETCLPETFDLKVAKS